MNERGGLDKIFLLTNLIDREIDTDTRWFPLYKEKSLDPSIIYLLFIQLLSNMATAACMTANKNDWLICRICRSIGTLYVCDKKGSNTQHPHLLLENAHFVASITRS